MRSLKVPYSVHCSFCCMSILLAHRYSKGVGWDWDQRSLIEKIPWYTPGSGIDMELSSQQSSFKIVLRHLSFETTLQILPGSGADDSILWHIQTSLIEWLCGVVVQTQILPECSTIKKKPSERMPNWNRERRADLHSKVSCCWHYSCIYRYFKDVSLF